MYHERGGHKRQVPTNAAQDGPRCLIGGQNGDHLLHAWQVLLTAGIVGPVIAPHFGESCQRDTNFRAVQVCAQALVETAHGPAGSGVGSCARPGHERRNGGHIDDTSAVAFEHGGQEGAGDVERRKIGRSHHSSSFIHTGFVSVQPASRAGVIEKYIGDADFSGDHSFHGGNGLWVGQIRGVDVGYASAAVDFLRQAFQFIL